MLSFTAVDLTPEEREKSLLEADSVNKDGKFNRAEFLDLCVRVLWHRPLDELQSAAENYANAKAMRPPTHPVRRAAYGIINSPAFDAFITGVIVANIGVMACDYWGIEESAHDRLMQLVPELEAAFVAVGAVE